MVALTKHWHNFFFSETPDKIFGLQTSFGDQTMSAYGSKKIIARSGSESTVQVRKKMDVSA